MAVLIRRKAESVKSTVGANESASDAYQDVVGAFTCRLLVIAAPLIHARGVENELCSRKWVWRWWVERQMVEIPATVYKCVGGVAIAWAMEVKREKWQLCG